MTENEFYELVRQMRNKQTEYFRSGKSISVLQESKELERKVDRAINEKNSPGKSGTVGTQGTIWNNGLMSIEEYFELVTSCKPVSNDVFIPVKDVFELMRRWGKMQFEQGEISGKAKAGQLGQ
jgi:hypothetical protein